MDTNEVSGAEAPDDGANALATGGVTPAKVETTAEATTADDGETPAAKDDAKGEGDKPKPKRTGGGFQNRVNQLTRDYRDTERDRDAWRELALSLQKGQSARPNSQASADQPPKPEQFASWDDYETARETYREERVAKRLREELRREIQAEQTKRVESETANKLRAKIEADSEKYDEDDVEAVMTASVFTRDMRDFLLESESPFGVALALARNPAEASRIAQLPPAAQGIALARIEAKLSATPKRTATSAPPPPKTVQGKGGGEKDPSKMTYAEFCAWRDKGGGT